MKRAHRDRIRAIKKGDVAREDVLDEIRAWESDLLDLVAHPTGVLLREPDLGTINAWMADAHRRWWDRRRT